MNAFVRDRQLQMLSLKRQYAKARQTADAANVKEFIERERALWTENNKLREFAEINYTAFYKVRGEVIPRVSRQFVFSFYFGFFLIGHRPLAC